MPRIVEDAKAVIASLARWRAQAVERFAPNLPWTLVAVTRAAGERTLDQDRSVADRAVVNRTLGGTGGSDGLEIAL